MKSKHPRLGIFFCTLILAIGCGRSEQKQESGKEGRSLLDRLQVEQTNGVEHPVKVVRDNSALKPVGDSLRVAAYNIQNFNDGENDGYNRTPLMVERQTRGAAEIIHSFSPDILIMEEIENGLVLERLNKKLPDPYAAIYVTDFEESRKNVKINVAVMSRVPLINVRELDFSKTNHPDKPPRGTIRFEVELSADRRLLVYGVHLKSNHGEYEKNITKRRAGLEIIRRDADAIVNSRKGYEWEVVIIGDYNTDPDAERFMEDPTLEPVSDWVDLWKGYPIEERTTLPSRFGDPALIFPPICFDRVVVSPPLKEEPWIVDRPYAVRRGVDYNNVYISAGQNDIHVSDHFPIFVDIRKKAEDPSD